MARKIQIFRGRAAVPVFRSDPPHIDSMFIACLIGAIISLFVAAFLKETLSRE
jgi:hypothetical protein